MKKWVQQIALKFGWQINQDIPVNRRGLLYQPPYKVLIHALVDCQPKTVLVEIGAFDVSTMSPCALGSKLGRFRALWWSHSPKHLKLFKGISRGFLI